MITPNTFAFHLTYTCPLSCAHCCFSSSPRIRGRLNMGEVERAIQALGGTSINLIAFTGGEPFLLGDALTSAVATAANEGFATRIVTSAYFATSPAAATAKLRPVAEAGLQELSISWDDYHEEFANFENVYNAFWAAASLRILPAVNVVTAAETRWTAKRVRARLGLPDDMGYRVVESPLNLTGRARRDLSRAGSDPSRFLGPCPYVLTGPTVSATGKFLACCGVIEHTEELVIAERYDPDRISEQIGAALNSPLLNWLHLQGPYTILSYISARFGIPVPSADEVGGNCEACHTLFHTPHLRAMIASAVAEKGSEIMGELEVLGALGLLKADTVQRLWDSKQNVARHSDEQSMIEPIIF